MGICCILAILEGPYDISPNPWGWKIVGSQLVDDDEDGLGSVLELFKSISIGCGGKSNGGGGSISLADPYNPESALLKEA
jgi:hypothetical protein